MSSVGLAVLCGDGISHENVETNFLLGLPATFFLLQNETRSKEDNMKNTSANFYDLFLLEMKCQMIVKFTELGSFVSSDAQVFYAYECRADVS